MLAFSYLVDKMASVAMVIETPNCFCLVENFCQVKARTTVKAVEALKSRSPQGSKSLNTTL
jgi:hypothetical protein